jgi:hypothetical protein
MYSPASLSPQEPTPMPLLHVPLTDAERAGHALAHPLSLQLTEPAVAALADIATRDTPATAPERHLLRQALAAIDAAEIQISRRAA